MELENIVRRHVDAVRICTVMYPRAIPITEDSVGDDFYLPNIPIPPPQRHSHRNRPRYGWEPNYCRGYGLRGGSVVDHKTEN